MSELLESTQDNPRVISRLFAVVQHGRLLGCADTVYKIYGRELSKRDSHVTRSAINVLGVIGTDAQKRAIRNDLIQARLVSNDLMAAALGAIGLDEFSLRQLESILRRATAESEYGGGELTQAIAGELIERVSPSGAVKITEAIVRTLTPRRKAAGWYISELSEPQRWRLRILPACLAKAVSLLNSDGSDAPTGLFEAAIYLERLRLTHGMDESVDTLRAAIEGKSGFRRKLLALIVLRVDEHAPMHLLWASGIVEFRADELDWMINQACSTSIDATTRERWFELVATVAYREFDARPRDLILQSVLERSGSDAGARRKYITNIDQRRHQQAAQDRDWSDKQAARDARQAAQLAENGRLLTDRMEGIREGTDLSSIKWLVVFCGNKRSPTSYTRIFTEYVGSEFGKEIQCAFDVGLAKLWSRRDAPNVLDYPGNQVPWEGLVGLASVNHALASGLAVEDMSDADITKCAKLCVWEIAEPPGWFKTMGQIRATVVMDALMPWIEEELRAVAGDSSISRTVDLVLQGPDPVKKPMLERALQMLALDQVLRTALQSRIFREARLLGLLDKHFAEAFITKMLAARLDDVSAEAKRGWLGEWLNYDLAGGWRWIQDHYDTAPHIRESVAVCVAEVLIESKWAEPLSGTAEDVALLISMYELLAPHTNAGLAKEAGGLMWHPVRRLRDSIVQVLSSLPGQPAHTALAELQMQVGEAAPGADWIRSLVVEHAATDAERAIVMHPASINDIGQPYCRDARTERELFQQVKARCEEIKSHVEHGAFSERIFFSAKMKEKHLQLWLAARLNDTPRRRFVTRRFGVLREPQVDFDKRTDIEISTSGFKVCVEIKPVDYSRYTATSLVKTLEEQLVGRYMKGGQNSRNGLLVLFRLDEKQWAIPNGERRASFATLVEFLRAESRRICRDVASVENLDVLGIDCCGSEADQAVSVDPLCL